MLHPSAKRVLGTLICLLLWQEASRAYAQEKRPLALPTLRAITRAADAKVAERPTAEELRLFQAVQEGRGRDEANLAEAFLFASGVTDADQRKAHLARLEQVVAQAEKASAGADNPKERGRALLKFLHAEPMAKGYVANQTSLAEILNKGKYNCVSSAALYNVIGKRLGLTLSAVDIPGGAGDGHAYSVLSIGEQKLGVETTSPDGFDAPDRRQGPPQGSRAIDDLGLASMIYYNRGVLLGRAGRPEAALRASLSALALDPANGSARQNIFAELTNWGNRLGKAGDFEKALVVIGVGLELDPKHASLLNNRWVTWMDYLEARVKTGRDDELVALFRRAAGVLSEADFAGIFRLQAQKEQDRKNYLRAANILARGLAVLPGNTGLDDGIAYLGQEWLKAVDNPEKAAEAWKALSERFPLAKGLHGVGLSHLHRRLRGLCDRGQFAQALADLNQLRPLAGDPPAVDELGGLVYDTWARKHLRAKEWEKAVEVYLEGLKAYPGADLLRTNVRASYDQWAREPMRTRDWAAAIRIYRHGLDRFPGDDHLSHNLGYCEGQQRGPTR